MDPQSKPHLLRFGIFEVDLKSAELRKAGMKQKLAGQPFQVLRALIEKSGQIVTREELRDLLWRGDTFVDYDVALKKAINRVREVLGDSIDSPRFIQTIHRQGYRFLAEVQAVESGRACTSVQRPVPWRLALGLTLVATAALLFSFNADKLRTRILAKSRSPEIRSIAVLPLENLSHDPNQEYFADGMTDDLITDLAQIGSVKVISRTSSMQYKQTKKPLPEIARELRVDGIVEGTVQRSGDRVRITSQLIDATNDRHLWARSYERDLKDVLALQDDVARDIADEIRVKLTPQEQTRLSTRRGISTPAYDAYLRGRYLWNQRNPEAIAEALGYFEEAVRDDPEFALGYSGLADCYWVGWGFKNDYEKAEEYAHKALSLEPDLAEAHVSLGLIRMYQYDLATADGELSRALDLNPNYSIAHHARAGYLLSLGRARNALEENDRARESDPFSIPINTFRTLILIGLRRYQEAADQVRMTLELAPQSALLHNLQSRIYWLQGRAPEAIAAQKQAGSLAKDPQIARDQDEVAAALEEGGLRAAQLKAAQLIEKDGSEVHFGAIFVALQYGMTENTAKTLYWLEKSFRAQDGNLLLLMKTAPEFDFLRSAPQFKTLLNRMGVPSP